MGTPSPGKFCPRCGTTNPPDYNFCANCHQPLPTGIAPPSPDNWRNSDPAATSSPPVTANIGENVLEIGRGAAGVVFIWIGVPLLLIGMGLLVGAVVSHQSAQSFDQACSSNPICTSSAPDPSGALTVAGILVLLLAIGFFAYGALQYSNRDR